MKIAVQTTTVDYAGYGNWSVAMEDNGFDTIMAMEGPSEPFVQAAVVAERTRHAEIMTAVAVAFGRSPLTLALAGHDLNALSGGRFILGLGSQLKAHIQRRYSMPWSHPARRMKELIQAVQAIWDCWYEGKPLDFKGEFFTHTLMTPAFTPTNTQFGRPKVHISAVGPMMTDVAGEVADGLVGHCLTTDRYLREVTLPRIESALARSNRARKDFEITGFPFIACGTSEGELQKAITEVRQQIAFYGSTRAYRHVLDLHGWSDLHEKLHGLAKQRRWNEMGEHINDNVLETFALVGSPEQIANSIVSRFRGIYDRVTLQAKGSGDYTAEIINHLKAQ